ncbi:MAG: hypothetical protein M3394_01570 [Actinomycetota bacterium]|nr:hypothetical protein [Actinomycetota bacterium]
MIETATGIAGIVGVLVAVAQFATERQRRKSQAERIAEQRERLAGARASAVTGYHSADLIVQRAKAADVTVPELQNLARIVRGHLGILAQQLAHEQESLQAKQPEAVIRPLSV